MSRGPIPILRIGQNLLATVQTDLHDAVAEAFQADVLGMLERTSSRGLLIDISALEIVDSYVARVLAETGKMARLMGADTVIVGMRPEVAATLVRMGYLMEDVGTALDLELGIAALERARRRGA